MSGTVEDGKQLHIRRRLKVLGEEQVIGCCAGGDGISFTKVKRNRAFQIML